MKSIKQANIQKGTRVFVRCELDVPIKSGMVLETFRLDQMLETLQYVLSRGAHLVLGGHIGRPKGAYNASLSTQQLLPYFNDKLNTSAFTNKSTSNTPSILSTYGTSERAEAHIPTTLPAFELLENLRFDPREEDNDPEFASELAKKADIYVNESFATCHRAHASIVGVPALLPSYAGFRLEKEVSSLEKVLVDPKRPLVVIIGGAKLESKKPLIDKFLGLADVVLVGGKLGLEWQGLDSTQVQGHKKIPDNQAVPGIAVSSAQSQNLQTSALIQTSISTAIHTPIDYAPNNLDIGPATIAQYSEIISHAKTVLWAGPLGLFEDARYSAGTHAIAQAITNSNAFSVAGGGDTINAINKFNLFNKFSFISTGGSAMLEFLVNGTLPGLEVLEYGA